MKQSAHLHLPDWMLSHLKYQFIAVMIACLLTTSLVFLLVFSQTYSAQLAQERSAASASINQLLQASLENAMLKHDLDGLRMIIERLGQQQGIHRAFITNPQQEVRFASEAQQLGQQLTPPPQSRLDYRQLQYPTTEFITNAYGEKVLRSINPVHNKPICQQCHGDLATNPINGILFVDYKADTIREKALQTVLLLASAGIFVVILVTVVMGWFIHYYVLRPVQQLVIASTALAEGQLSSRVPIANSNELGRLGDTFNQMAQRLQQSLQHIEEQKQFLQSLLDAIPDGIRVIDSEYHIVHYNQAYQQQLGTASNHHFCYTSSYARQTPCAPTLMTCPLHEIKQHAQPLKLITEHVRDDGNKLQVEVCAAPMWVNRNGQRVLLIVEAIRDLTQSIAFSHEQKLSSVGQLAAGVAHEIYNPLSSIRLALQATLRDLNTPDFTVVDIKHYLQLVDTQIDKCIEVTQRLLKLSSSSGEAPRLVSLNEVIQDTVALLAFELEARHIKVRFEIDAAELSVLAAESDIRMLVLNLVQNAFHAMPTGGEIWITGQIVAQQVRFSVRDTGVGIRAVDLPKIFDPFFTHRADGLKGTGLGLSICKSIVERYGGKIEVDGRVPEGARFIVTLPSAVKAMALVV